MHRKLVMSKHRTASGVEYEVGTGNVFADLGLPNPEELMLKAELAMQIRNLVKRQNLTQVQVARATGLDQPRVSKLLSGRLVDFSLERLFVVLQRLGHRVEVRISAKAVKPQEARARVLVG